MPCALTAAGSPARWSGLVALVAAGPFFVPWLRSWLLVCAAGGVHAPRCRGSLALVRPALCRGSCGPWRPLVPCRCPASSSGLLVFHGWGGGPLLVRRLGRSRVTRGASPIRLRLCTYLLACLLGAAPRVLRSSAPRLLGSWLGSCAGRLLDLVGGDGVGRLGRSWFARLASCRGSLARG